MDNFDRLPDDLAAQITLGLNGLDVTRLYATSRTFKQLLKVLWSGTEADEDSTKPKGLHYWSRLERSTRTQHHIPTAHAAPWRAAFQDAPLAVNNGAQAGQQGPPGAVFQPNPAALAALQALQEVGGAAAQQLVQFRVPTHRNRFLTLTAAGSIGGWWGPQAENDGGAALTAALQLLQECLGNEVTGVIRLAISHAGSDHPAHSFWGSLFLGLLLSTTRDARRGGATLLMQQLLLLETGGCNIVPSRLVPVRVTEELSSRDSTLQSQHTSGWMKQPCHSRYVGYQLREFLSAVLVLLRLEPMRSRQLQDLSALDQLQYEVLQVLLLRDAAERDAAAVLPPELATAEFRAKMGLPDGAELTAEQIQIFTGAIRPLEPGVIGDVVPSNALAGTSKSSTCRGLALAHPNKRILYTAYNRSVVDDARGAFPANVTCSTTHQLANAAMWEFKQRGWSIDNIFPSEVQRRLREVPFYVARTEQGQPGPSVAVAAIVKDMMECFTTSADDDLGQQHIPPESQFVRNPPDFVLLARQYWNMVRTSRAPRGGGKATHNMYLKAFALDLAAGRTQLPEYDVILIDEAQDINPVTLQILMSQRCTRVLVGDRYQHIYSFNYCCNALNGDAEAAARRAGTLARTSLKFGLTNSFRLGPAVAEVANRILWQLGERLRPMIGAGFKKAAVYGFRFDPPDVPADPAVAALAALVPGLDDMVGGEPGTAHCEQMQVLLTPDEPTDVTPQQLEVQRLKIRARQREGFDYVHLAKPPINPETGRPYGPLWYITRYNSTWFEVCAALVSPAPGGSDGGDHNDDHGAPGGAGMPAGLEAGAAVGAAVVAAPAAAAVAGPAAIPSIHLTAADNNGDVYLLKLLLDLEEFRSRRRKWFRHYRTWEELQAGVQTRDDTDLMTAFSIVQRYQQRVPQLVADIRRRLVPKEDAELILGTCHKAKGGQEDYVQLADDFAEIRQKKRSRLLRIQDRTPEDEYNLVYVAATRARIALICNKDVQKLLEEADERLAVVKVQTAAAPAHQCSHCHAEIPAVIADLDEDGPRVGATLSAGWMQRPAPQPQDPLNAAAAQDGNAEVLVEEAMCWRCMDEICIWGQLGGDRQHGQNEELQADDGQNQPEN